MKRVEITVIIKEDDNEIERKHFGFNEQQWYRTWYASIWYDMIYHMFNVISKHFPKTIGEIKENETN